MPFPIKVCVVCEEEFELRPGKPGFANRCMECSVEDEAKSDTSQAQGPMDAIDRKVEAEANEARRKAIREMLYSGK